LEGKIPGELAFRIDKGLQHSINPRGEFRRSQGRIGTGIRFITDIVKNIVETI